MCISLLKNVSGVSRVVVVAFIFAFLASTAYAAEWRVLNRDQGTVYNFEGCTVVTYTGHDHILSIAAGTTEDGRKSEQITIVKNGKVIDSIERITKSGEPFGPADGKLFERLCGDAARDLPAEVRAKLSFVASGKEGSAPPGTPEREG